MGVGGRWYMGPLTGEQCAMVTWKLPPVMSIVTMLSTNGTCMFGTHLGLSRCVGRSSGR